MRTQITPVLAAICLTVSLNACKKPADTAGENTTNTATAPATTSVPAQDGQHLPANAGQEIGYVYEAWLSPHQEPGEEKDTPNHIPKDFQSTQPSKLRADRKDRGYGRIRFTRDLSHAYVDVKLEDVNVEEINMFHIHCGRPDQLGPILVDFSLITDIKKNILEDGIFNVEVWNKDIEAESAAGHGLIGAFTAGCPIVPGQPDEVKTVAGMEHIASKGELYFNLHTEGQTYFGDVRGQIHRADEAESAEGLGETTAAPQPADSAGHHH